MKYSWIVFEEHELINKTVIEKAFWVSKTPKSHILESIWEEMSTQIPHLCRGVSSTFVRPVASSKFYALLNKCMINS